MSELFGRQLITNDDDADIVIQQTDDWRMRNRWRQKHAEARLFYSGRRDDILAIWKTVIGDRVLRPATWYEFVHTKDLWDLVYQFAECISAFTIEEWGNNEVADEGVSILTDEYEEYWLVCTAPWATTPLSRMRMTQGMVTLEYATQRFLACVLIYAFADIYGKEFPVRYLSHPDLLVDKDTVNRPIQKVPEPSG